MAAPWLAPAANAVPSAAAPAATAAPAKVATPNTATPNATTTVLVVGDSLSAEYGLPRGTGWVALLSRRLAEQHSDYSVRNASISGDTTSGGRARLAALLARERPAVVILELGGNDALRGVPLATSRNNLAAMIEASQRAGARVVLVGMQIPPNYGPTYARDFSSMYPALAKEKAVMLVPFLLEGMADDPTMFQPDQIHPTVAAQARLLDNVWPVLRPLLKAKR
ncbi:arylesterase [Chitinasiproducens palmae]|uniref:arylesterase n=1 Tax=Chitinasiproducens palmae TaxID=1770053 RepID=UPI0038B39A44